MAEYYLIKETTLTGIADAIRSKTGSTDPVPVSSMAEQISVITGGGVEDPHVLMAEQDLPFSASGMTGVTLWQSDGSDISLTLIEGETYTVVWNDTEYVCKAQAATFSGVGGIGIGNFGAVGLGAMTNEPFLMGVAANGAIACYCFIEGSSHKVGIYDLGTTGGGGGGSVEGVHYVTFMDETGSAELYKRPVADGDDCADPVERLLMDEPTKESTAQYVYDHNGWATTAGGAADSNALKAVTEDKTVYAAFAESLRYYTITYMDSDGTTLLKTESLAYGSTPNYEAEKSGYGFNGWTPSLATVTGDASYTASWVFDVTFANGSWEDIAAVCESGKASETFSIGDTKTVSFLDLNGNQVSATARIIGFNHDNLTDGTGKAAMSILLYPGAFAATAVQGTSKTNYDGGWASCGLRTVLNDTIFSGLPESLQNVIKSVTKESTVYVNGTDTTGIVVSEDKLWLLSHGEYGVTSSTNSAIAGGDGDVYIGLHNGSSTILRWATVCPSGYMLLRSGDYTNKQRLGSLYNPGTARYSLSYYNTSGNIVFGFCI